jgi:hypothetical protein
VAREFEELIMVPHGGIEYMAGGTGAHPTIGRRALVGNAKATAKTKPLGKRKSKINRNTKTLTPTPTCA